MYTCDCAIIVHQSGLFFFSFYSCAHCSMTSRDGGGLLVSWPGTWVALISEVAAFPPIPPSSLISSRA